MFDLILCVSIGWILSIIGFVILMLIKFTFKYDGKSRTPPFREETLGMPKGTFRGILTLTSLFAVIIIEIVKMAYYSGDFSEEFTVLDKLASSNSLEINNIGKGFMDTFQIIIAFYFGGNIVNYIADTNVRRKEKEIQLGMEMRNDNMGMDSDPGAVG